MLLLAMLLTGLIFSSCSKDSDQINNLVPEEGLNARLAAPLLHNMTIINNSHYRFAIFAMGAQSNYDMRDNIEIYHKNTPPLILNPGKSVIYEDYQMVSDPIFKIESWNVIDYSAVPSELGAFSPAHMSTLYGILSQPNQPNSPRYPVWKYIQGGVLDDGGQYFTALTGNNFNASLGYLGNRERGYNSVIKYGTSTVIADSRISENGVPINGNAKVTVRWSQASAGVRSTGSIKITIENIR